MRHNNRRKLIHKSLLTKLTRLSELGVPNAKLIRENNLDISHPHFSKLIEYYRLSTSLTVTAEGRQLIHNSLFPEWLTEPLAQQPLEYTYKGKFPYGQWDKAILKGVQTA